jgi:hypothetical protein
VSLQPRLAKGINDAIRIGFILVKESLFKTLKRELVEEKEREKEGRP